MQAESKNALFFAARLALPMLVVDHMTATAQAAGRVSCEIRASRHDGGGKLDAIIRATGPIAGTFMFVARKRGSGGCFRIRRLRRRG
jgi:hypothetical protein